MPGLYVQYGCGTCAPAGWRNFDASPTLLLQRLPVIGPVARRIRTVFPATAERGDIVRGLPLAPASCCGIYASHVLEHLALTELRTALRHTFELLAPGGLFRLVVPDLRVYAQRYLAAADSGAAERFMEETCLGMQRRPNGVRGRILEMFGNARHLWMWDEASMARELSQAGFVEIRACVPGDSEDARFREVEDAGRFIDAVGLQARRAAATAAP